MPGAPDYFKSILLYGLDTDDEAISAYITDDGRFVFRLEDWPDIWGEAARVGIAELIASLSPVKRWDRRGDIVHWDDLTQGMGAISPGTSGTGAAVEISDDYFLYGGYSLKLTGGSDTDKYASATVLLSVPLAKGVGLECGLCLKQTVEFVELQILTYDTAAYHLGKVRYNAKVGTFAYYGQDSAYHDFATIQVYPQEGYLFHWLKLVIDPPTNKYLRLILPDGEIDMSAYSVRSVPASYVPHIRCTITVYSYGATNGIAYVDPIIITQNEPE